MHRGRKLHKWKTGVQRGTQTLIFDRYYNHDVSHLEFSDISLRVSVLFVMDYRMFLRKKTLGVALIGPNVPERHGRDHWSQMLASMGEVSMWHPLLPPATIH